MHLIFGEEKIKSMLETLNSKKAVVLVFLIFLIPGVPKDLCNYVAGLSEMKLKPFLIVSLIGRSGNDGQPAHRKTDIHRRICQRCRHRSCCSRSVRTGADIQEKDHSFPGQVLRKTHEHVMQRSHFTSLYY